MIAPFQTYASHPSGNFYAGGFLFDSHPTLFFYEKPNTPDNEIAIKRFKEAISHDSSFALPWTYLSMCYWRRATTADQPEFQESKKTAEKAIELDPNSAVAIVNIAEILDNEYDFQGAENKIKLALKIDPGNPYVPAYWIALTYAYGDNPLKVFEWLEKSYDRQERDLTYLGVDPAFKKYRNNPRIVNLLNKMKYPV